MNMSVKEYLESVRQRLVYARMVINERDNLWSCEQTLFALRNDNGSGLPDSATDSSLCNHYKFGNQGVGDLMGMACDELNDYVAVKIGDALKKSKKATAITLSHGIITDKGMTAFLKGLNETEAPIKALHFNDLQRLSDKSLSLLPEIIEKKGITLCEIEACWISEDLKKRINLACSKNQSTTILKDKNSMLR